MNLMSENNGDVYDFMRCPYKTSGNSGVIRDVDAERAQLRFLGYERL